MKKSTGELLELLKRTSVPSSFMENASKDLIRQIPLSKYLTQILDSHSLQKSELIRRSGLDRSYVYDILSGKRDPSRDKVLALCFAVPLSADETQKLLKTTGYAPLYVRLERDSIIFFGLQHGLPLAYTNELLYEMNYTLLE